MRKFIVALVLLLLALPALQAAAQANGNAGWLDTAKLAEGVVGIRYAVNKDIVTRVTVAKGEKKYTYTITAGEAEVILPLQLGNGEYTISVLENTTGNKYQVKHRENVKLELKDDNAVYLNAIQLVNWNDKGNAAKKAVELAKKQKTDTQKAKAIYDYIVDTIKYDEKLAADVATTYIPNIDQVIATKKGICYDYAALFAAMLRANGIPAKLVMGNSAYVDTYHAWNEVYLDGEWVIMDTTVDAAYKNKNKKIDLYKKVDYYAADKQY